MESNAKSPKGSDVTAVTEFLRVWFSDEDRGSTKSLTDYQRLFAGHEAAIAAAYGEIVGRTTRVVTRSEGNPLFDLETPVRIGPYEILRLLGAGGQGQVFLARDPRIDRQVALKVLHPDALGPERDALARFRREAEVAARLDHPAICPIYELDQDGGRPFIVMPYLRGKTLARILAESRDLPDREMITVRVRWIETVARAVDLAHEAGVIHRDLKPANLLIDEQGSPVILDFGLARDLVKDATLKTRSGALLGTLAYMAPEQLRATSPADRRVDVYALGATLFEALTGGLPFDTATEARAIESILNDPPEDARHRNPAVSADLAIVLQTALEKDPDRRYRTARALAEELGRVLQREPVLARPLPIFVRALRGLRRRPALAASLLVGALATLVGLAVALFLLSGLREAEREVRHLADTKRAQDLLAEEAQLWPALPAKTQALSDWISRANALLERRAVHRETRERLAERRLSLAPTGPSEDADWISWQLQVLEELDQDLDRLSERLPTVAARQECARTIAERSLDAHRAAWDRDADYARSDSRYRRIALRPIMGLVPLGPDPDSGFLEYAHLLSGDAATRDPDHGRLRINRNSGVVLVLLPGGKVRIGASPAEAGGAADGPHCDATAEAYERPVHEVELSPYFLSKYEVTQGQWQRWTGRNPSRYPVGMNMGRGAVTELHPVESVTWLEASLTLSNLDLLLPTEVQWEAGARAGTSTKFFTGDDLESLTGAANLKDQSCARVIGTDLGKHEATFDDGYAAHAPVYALLANGFGLHGIHGNVGEWCADAFGPYSLPTQPGDGRRQTPEDGYRALRGGSYLQLAWNARSSNRAKVQQSLTDFTIGLRPSRPFP